MQTFLPMARWPDSMTGYKESAACLDDRRLGNQIKECAQILAACYGGAAIIVRDEPVLYSIGYTRSHPAVKMWIRYEASLCRYACAIVDEYRSRGRRGMVVYEKMFRRVRQILDSPYDPLWLSDIGPSHRSQLLLKDPVWYSQFGWSERPGSIPYLWPE